MRVRLCDVCAAGELVCCHWSGQETPATRVDWQQEREQQGARGLAGRQRPLELVTGRAPVAETMQGLHAFACVPGLTCVALRAFLLVVGAASN